MDCTNDLEQFYPHDLESFADMIFWNQSGRDVLDNKPLFLLQVMHHCPRGTYDFVKRHFPKFTDDDYRDALRHYSPGFFWPNEQEEWEYWHKKFGVEPVPPIPKPGWRFHNGPTVPLGVMIRDGGGA